MNHLQVTRTQQKLNYNWARFKFLTAEYEGDSLLVYCAV